MTGEGALMVIGALRGPAVYSTQETRGKVLTPKCVTRSNHVTSSHLTIDP